MKKNQEQVTEVLCKLIANNTQIFQDISIQIPYLVLSLEHCRALVCTNYQVCPEVLYWDQVLTLVGPLYKSTTICY